MSEIMTIESAPLAIDQHPAAVYLAGLAPGSVPAQRSALNEIASLLTGEANALAVDWSALRFQHVAAVRARLAECYAPATANRMLAALRGVLKAAWLLGQMSAEDYHRAVAVESVRGETIPAGRELSAGEIAALMADCAADQSAAGARDAALIALLYGCGLRRAEAIALDRDDLDLDAGTLRVRGKRSKERLVPLVNGTKAALADWLAVRGDEPGPLFWPVDKAGRPTARRLSAKAIERILEKRARRAGCADFSPHDLRRSFVSHLLDAGADIATVAKLAGHANIQTTARYDRRPEEAKRRAAELLHVPYTRRATLL